MTTSDSGAGSAPVSEVVSRAEFDAPLPMAPPAPPSLAAILGPAGLLRVALLAGGMSFLFWDQFVRLFRKWTENPDWSHGFLVPLFSLYFLNSKRAELAALKPRGSWLGLVILALAIWGYFYAVRNRFGSPQPFAIVLSLAALIILFGGWSLLKIAAFPVFYLLLALPPPEYVYRDITHPLQQVAAAASEVVLKLLPGVWIERRGVNIAFETAAGGSGNFTVAGACSGMRSLMAFIALGLAMAYFAPRPLWQRVFMCLIVVPVAVFCNVIRVVVTGAFQIYNLGDLASGTPHALLGVIMFAIGFGIYFGVLYILDHLFVQEEDEGARFA